MLSEISTSFNFQARHPFKLTLVIICENLGLMMSVWPCSSSSTSNIRKSEGYLEPTGDGILIFDEVRVQGNVVWNSKNNQVIELAMSQRDLPSLQDVYTQLDAEDSCLETRYILQFVWRDLTSKFDIVGPYYTSNAGFDMKLTMACFYDALLLFETYKFQTIAIIGDGASWNQALFKKLCGYSGKFGVDAVPDGNFFDVPASFTNPFSGNRVWCIVCPSHEVRHFPIFFFFQS